MTIPLAKLAVSAALGLRVLVACAGSAHAQAQPADTARRAPSFKRHSVVPLPAFFYSPETRFGGGAAVLHAFRSSAEGRPVASGASAMYTQNHQIAAGVSTDAFFDGARHHVNASIGYAKFPNTYYGIGNATVESDSESYTPRTFSLDATAERLVAPGVYVGVGGDFAEGRLVEVQAGRSLASGLVRGSEGGRISGFGTGITYDTRDNILAAESGAYARVSVRRYAAVLGSDYDFTWVRVDLRHYRTFLGRHVIAAQAAWTGTGGDVPFDRLPKLGGQNLLRGYYEGRYRDKQYVAAQAEYRTPSWHRMGLAAFVGAGEVAPRVSDLRLAGLHAAAGAGFRIMLSRQERLALRLDYGAGGGSSGMYITVSEAF